MRADAQEADFHQATRRKWKDQERFYSFHFCLNVSDRTNVPVRDSGTEVAGSRLCAHRPSVHHEVNEMLQQRTRFPYPCGPNRQRTFQPTETGEFNSLFAPTRVLMSWTATSAGEMDWWTRKWMRDILENLSVSLFVSQAEWSEIKGKFDFPP